MFQLILFSISIVAGFVGSLLGIGGGMIVVPVLTLCFEVDIRYAIAASLISIIATSSGAAASYLRDHFTNVRVAILLELGTVSGAITGFLISSYIQPSALYLVFGFFLVFSAVMMIRRRDEAISTTDHPWSQRLRLASSYPNDDGERIYYNVEQVPSGLFLMYFAGILSALLGIGSGILKVLAMDSMMKFPIKVSSATSNFMIGVTAAASASAYLLRGDIRPEIAAPLTLGILLGSWSGAKMMIKLKSSLLRKLFVVLLIFVSLQMMRKGLNW
jgi:uncharacterized protein